MIGRRIAATWCAVILAAAHACSAPAPAPVSASASVSVSVSVPVSVSASASASASASVSVPVSASVPLFRRYPALASRIPHVPLGVLPTPVDHAVELGRRLGLDALYVKRDDLSGAPYGGNKVRKLEFILADAVRAGRKVVVTTGGAGSHHALATAVYARRLGLDCILLLLPQPPDDEVRRNLLAGHRAGAALRLSPRKERIDAAIARMIRDAPPDQAPYVIAAGGSSVLGNVGSVNAAFELADQIDAGQLPVPDRIYIAAGTLGSAVGLSVGLKAAGLRTRVIAVQASSPEHSSEQRMIAMFAETGAYLRSLDPSFPELTLPRDEAVLVHSELGAGYAVPTRAATAAVTLFREATGVELETTYTGKALAALVHDAPSLAGQVVLFWNTYSSTLPDISGARPEDLPREFRGYFDAPPSRAR